MHNSSTYQAPQPPEPPIKPENMHQSISAVPDVYTNGASSLQPCMQVGVNMIGNAGRMDVSENLIIAQNSNTGIMQGMNGVMQGMNGIMIKSESDYTGDSSSMFGADNNPLEPRNATGEASASNFNGAESSSLAFNENMLDPEMNSFGFLGQIPRNFSLSDLTADFSNSTGWPLSLSLPPTHTHRHAL